MAKSNYCYLVSWINEDGVECKGYVYVADQTSQLEVKNKVIVIKCDDNFVINKDEKKIIKTKSKLTVIGYID